MSGREKLQSSIDRIKRKIPTVSKHVSLVYFDSEGNTVDVPPAMSAEQIENLCLRPGCLMVPVPMSEDEWCDNYSK